MPTIIRFRLPMVQPLCQSARYIASKSLLYSKLLPVEKSSSAITSTIVSCRETEDCTSEATSATGSSTSFPLMVNTEDARQALITASHFQTLTGTQGPSTGGIDWVIAGIGIQLWLNARAQTETPFKDPALLRSMHLDAVRYMNLALPTDMSSVEINTLHSSLPQQLKQNQPPPGQSLAASKSNILRRSVAQIVCWIIAIVLVAVPLLMTALNRLLIYEREHHVARRLLSNGTEALKALGERGLDLSDTLIRCKDSSLGRASLNASVWVLESVAGGLNDGLMQGTHGEVRLLELQP